MLYIEQSGQLEMRRLEHSDLVNVIRLMNDVISRLPSQDLFAMDDEDYFREIFDGNGEVYGAFKNGSLVAFSVLAFPGGNEGNLGTEFGVWEEGCLL